MEKKDEQNKDKKLKPKEEEQKELEEKINAALEELEKQIGIDKKNFKIIKVDTSLKKVLKEGLIFSLINIILIMSISGFLVWAKVNNILYFLYFALIFSSIELILNIFLNRFASKWIIKTLGLIFYLPPLISLVATTGLSSFIEIVNIYRLLIMFIILMLSRGFIKNRIIRRG